MKHKRPKKKSLDHRLVMHCLSCGRPQFISRSDNRFCSGACRTRAYRERHREEWRRLKERAAQPRFEDMDEASRADLLRVLQSLRTAEVRAQFIKEYAIPTNYN
jgi:hypothetical protein